MRPLALLPVALLPACLLVQNPGFDAAVATSSGATTGEPEDPGTTGGTGSDGATTTGTTDEPTTGCVAEPLFADADNDGFGAGAATLRCPGAPGFVDIDGDCDDADDAVSPDAPETCNQRDDDCDGLQDEASEANLACANCELATLGAHSYWFCTDKLDWDAARGVCQGFGPVDLAILDDVGENEFILAHNPADPGNADSAMWLGGRDSDPVLQATYTWYDGSPLTYNNFSLANLDDGCIVMTTVDAGKWRDRECSDIYYFTCESKG